MINNLLTNQNKLLEQMNGLIERQNQILQSQPSATYREVFVKDIDRDEMRSGILVTSQRKKLWNVQIGLINEFARVCKKYNLRWFACGGTLLGAARHKGFIPWDDDVDVAMFRPDYNKFLAAAYKEIDYPFFVDNWYDYTIESEETSESSGAKFQFISRKQEMKNPYRWFTQWPSIRLRDSRTTFIEGNFIGVNTIHQGIFLDIFPFDSLPPFTENKDKINFGVACELLLATAIPRKTKDLLKTDRNFLINRNSLVDFLRQPFRKRGRYFDNFAEKIFIRSEKIGDIRNYGVAKGFSFDTKDFDATVYLPFEKITIPAPSGWENCLTAQYGDWRNPVYTHNHAADYSADIPYTEYYKTSVFMK